MTEWARSRDGQPPAAHERTVPAAVARAGRADLLLPLLLALLPALAYAPAWWEGRLLAPGDGTALHYPLRSAVWEAYRQGALPGWNHSIFLGTPLLAAYRPGALHPLMIALAALPSGFLAFQVLVLASLALAGAMLYLYLRRLGAEPVGAYVGGLCFALGPYLVSHLEDTATLVAAPLLPLLLLALERWLERPVARRGALAAVALALLLLAGSPEAARAGMALLAARLLMARLWPGPLPPPPWLLTAAWIAAGLALAAPQLVPTLAAAAEAGRPVTGLASPPGSLPGLTGLILRYASHSPAPPLAIAALPLLATQMPVRALGAALILSLALQVGRGPLTAPGASALVFDLALCVLAGLSLSAQWRARREPAGAALRAGLLVTSLATTVALSVSAAALGPMPQTLAGAVGVLALAMILYFAQASSPSPLRAGLWLLPLTVSFLLQPHARRVWEEAPTAEQLREGSGTRQAFDRAMGRRASEPALALVREWPRAEAADLLYGNLAGLSQRRSANGYDPLVPLRTRVALGGMSVGGVLPEAFFRSDPARLELLGVRWVQLPTSVLESPQHMQSDLPLRIELNRPRWFPFPVTLARGLRLVSSLAQAAELPQGQVVGSLHLRLASGRGVFSFPLRAGMETAEWAWDRPDVRARAAHQRPLPAESWTVAGEGFEGHHYEALLQLPGAYFVDGVRFEPTPESFRLQVARLALVEARTRRLVRLSPAAVYVSDTSRFHEVAATPHLRLFELRTSPGPARVAAAVHRLPDEATSLDAVARPSHYGIDTRRAVIATSSDTAALRLPAESRGGRAELIHTGAGHVEVRADGPGLLVLAEGFDPGWSAEVDGRPAPVHRVNHVQLGVALAEGPHRVVLRYRPRGLLPGLVLAALTAVLLAAAARRQS